MNAIQTCALLVLCLAGLPPATIAALALHILNRAKGGRP